MCIFGLWSIWYHGCSLGTNRFFRKTEELLLLLVRPTWLPGHSGNFRGIEPFACLSSQRNFILQCASEKFQLFEHEALDTVICLTSYVESHILNMLDVRRGEKDSGWWFKIAALKLLSQKLLSGYEIHSRSEELPQVMRNRICPSCPILS